MSFARLYSVYRPHSGVTSRDLGPRILTTLIPGPESRLEYQDWVFEAAAGLYLFYPIERYRQTAYPRDGVRRDDIEVRAWLEQGAPLLD